MRARSRGARPLAALAVTACALVLPAVVPAATITVTTTADEFYSG
ncbi:MAG TPA: hypothetical protein VKA89_02435 [Solirubrobacterales bacterium]|nr:hypothetical protein [Solirubrobacterales bacterium]